LNDFYYQISVTQSNTPKLTYSSSKKIPVGARVVVSIRHRLFLGLVMKENSSKPSFECKPIIQVIDKQPIFDSSFIELIQWISNYYNYETGSILKSIIPSEFFITNDFIIHKKLNNTDIQTNQIENKLIEMVQNKSILFSQLKKNIPKISFSHLSHLINNNIISLEEIRIHRGNSKTEKKYFNTEKGEKYLEDIKWKKKYPARYSLIHSISQNKSGLSAAELGKKYSLLKELISESLIQIKEIQVERTDHLNLHYEKQPEQWDLTENQKTIFLEIQKKLFKNEYIAYLLYGVTGSGKTEIYIQLVKRMIEQKKSAVILVPEIALTPKLTWLFKNRLNHNIEIIHSGLSSGERYDAWNRIIVNDFTIVIGARSALFSPVKNLGLIIIDEEHEQTYKQSNTPPYYHARDAAVMLASIKKIPIVLGSATPSVESWYNAKNNKYIKLVLPERINKKPLPNVIIKELSNKKNSLVNGFLSLELFHLIKNRIKSKEQIILFLNRRGYAPIYLCRNCGKTVNCPNCDIPLNYHKSEDFLKCHYCGFLIPPENQCSNCGNSNIQFKGLGLQKMKKELKKIFPEARIIRMDQDTTRFKNSHYNILKKFENYEFDILIGTQMITKGLDFHNVTLVGVIQADIGLNLPDFRSSEKTFNLLTQVTGRAGRGEKEGKSVIQTYDPSHYCIRFAKTQNYAGFIEQELSYRKSLLYPPFKKIILIKGICQDEVAVKNALNELKSILLKNIKNDSHLILGPSECLIKKTNNQYRYQLIVKTNKIYDFNKLYNRSFQQLYSKFKRNIKWHYDVDPQSII